MGKAKRIRQQRESTQPKLLGKVVISVFDNGTVNVKGPINDGPFIMDVMGRALNAISAHQAKLMKGNAGRILTPQPGLILPN